MRRPRRQQASACSDTRRVSKIIVTTNNPVVFTDGAGPYGADELHAPYFPALENHVIEYSLGVTPVVVWVTPQDSIPDIRAIHSIVVIAQDDSTVTLQVSGQPGQTGRVRFSVYLLAE